MSVVSRMPGVKNFHFVGVKTVPDGQGGSTTSWAYGEPFIGVDHMDNSTNTRVAEQDGFTAIYTFIAEPDLDIIPGDIFLRDFDEQTFRVTSDPNDQMAPSSAYAQIKEFGAELYELPEKPASWGIVGDVARVSVATKHFPDDETVKEEVETVVVPPVDDETDENRNDDTMPPVEPDEEQEPAQNEQEQEEQRVGRPDGQGGMIYD